MAISKKLTKVTTSLMAAGVVASVAAAPAHATDLAPFTTIFNTDFTTAGYGGMRGNGTGTLTLSGVTGSITKAYLYWHGPANTSDPAGNQNVSFAGNAVSGTFLGISSD